jgi:hypothetical protein
LAAALFYGCCSISMNFLNKAVVSSFDFNFPFFIMVCQMIITVIVLDSLRFRFNHSNLINFGSLVLGFKGWPDNN